MEKEIIESVSTSLPESRIGDIPEDYEIWEETDGGAHFKVTRHIIPTADKIGLEILSMSVSGIPSERIRIVDEFSEVFGTPITRDMHPDEPYRMEIAAWLLNAHQHKK
ncbi:MAG: hypothetical protein WCK26_04085 [Candidatus Saccharibacteria bacterium]